MRKQLSALSRAVLGFAAGMVFACSPPSGEPPPTYSGPVVIITVSALPASLVGALGGEPGWTPNLDQLAEEVWHTRAVAHSTSPIPSLASLMTGVDPWIHQVTSHRAGALRADVVTLAEALGAEGWSSQAFFPPGRHLTRHGLLEDFGTVEQIGHGEAAAEHLATMAERQLAWIHLPDPGFPYLDRRDEVAHLAARPQVGERIERRWLMPYADPEKDMPEPLLSAARELFRHEVARADQSLGRLIDALRRNPAWEEATVFLTALHGNELEAQGQVLFAQNVGRLSLEVPLFVKLPARKDELPSPALVSTTRLAATVFDMAGLKPVVAQAGSLLGPPPTLIASALYDHDGLNRFSAIEPGGGGGGLQLIWSSRYADPEPEMWAAQAAVSGLQSLRLRETPAHILRRLHTAFERTPPLTGRDRDAAMLSLMRWREDGGVEPVQDPLASGRLAAELRRDWLRFIGRERSPRAEVRYWSSPIAKDEEAPASDSGVVR